MELRGLAQFEHDARSLADRVCGHLARCMEWCQLLELQRERKRPAGAHNRARLLEQSIVAPRNPERATDLRQRLRPVDARSSFSSSASKRAAPPHRRISRL